MSMGHQLFALLRDYYALTPNNKLHFPSECSPKAINDFLVTKILITQHHQRYPPSVQYQLRFWKWALENLEKLARFQSYEEDNEDFEIDCRMYDHYMTLLLLGGSQSGSNVFGKANAKAPLQSDSIPSQSYITHFWSARQQPYDSLPLESATYEASVYRNNYYTASLLESRTVIESGTTGLRTWLASFVLAQYLILHPDFVTSKCVLELGSGVGFLGIIIASLQRLAGESSESKGSCWLTDVNDEVLARCHDNISLSCNISAAHTDIHYLKLDWLESLTEEGQRMTALIHENINPDVILGADLAFAPSLIPALAATLKISLQPSSSSITPKIAIMAITKRNEDTLNEFLDRVTKVSLHIEELTVGFDKTLFSETIENHSSCRDVKLFRISLSP